MGEARLEPTVLKVRQLIADYQSGRIVIPEFQREYVWRKNKAPKLIDSLYRRYPISSLLLWSSSEPSQPRRRSSQPTRAGLTSWLIDGQQRVITLSRCLSGDGEIDVVFHAEQKEFRLANGATRRDKNWFRVSELLDDDLYRETRRNLTGPLAEDREREFERLRLLLDYEVPVVRMVDHSFDDAVNAFSRINTLGVKLKAGDIESAQIAARHSGFIADQVSPFLDRLRGQGFTRLNVMHLFRLCAFVATPDLRTKTPLHELERQDVMTAWRAVEKGALKILELVQSEWDLTNMDILWSGALLVPPMAIAATCPDFVDLRQSITGWIATAAVFHRYSRSVESSLDQDLKACRQADPIGALLANIRRDHGSADAVADDFAGSATDRGALLGLYVACRQNRIRIALGANRNTPARPLERHYILPRNGFPQSERSEADCVANVMYVSGDLHQKIQSSGYEVDFAGLPPSVRTNLCIPEDPDLWTIARAAEFWEARRELLAAAFNEFLKVAFPNRQVGRC